MIIVPLFCLLNIFIRPATTNVVILGRQVENFAVENVQQTTLETGTSAYKAGYKMKDLQQLPLHHLFFPFCFHHR